MATPEQLMLRQRLDLTDKEIELFIAQLDKFLSVNLRKILKDLPTGKDKALNAASMLSGIRSALEGAGLAAEIGKLDALYGSQMKAVQDAFSEVKERDKIYSEADIQVIEQLIKFDEKVVANKIYQATDSLSSSLFRQIISGSKVDIELALSGVSETTARQIQTEMRTATSGFFRSVTHAKAKELGVEFLVYIGPDDGITRAFCKERVNRIYSRDVVSRWDNGQGLPALIYAGGYNCRHDLVPITKEKAEQRVSQGVYEWG